MCGPGFCDIILSVSSNFLIISLRKRALVAMILLHMYSYCRMGPCVMCLFIVVLWVGLWHVIEAFPGHTHLISIGLKQSFLLLILNAPIARKVVCFSRLLKCLKSLNGKQCEPRSDCFYRSSLFWVHAVWFHT